MSVATTILEQLGGRTFTVMTGSKNYADGGTYLSMHLTTNKLGAKYLKIELTQDDLYTMTFAKLGKKGLVILSEIAGLCWDQLREIFTQETGLYTSLRG